ncbi:MAG: tRNA-dihydrouridine synthase family protein, partial [Pseudomonadota bacterium]
MTKMPSFQAEQVWLAPMSGSTDAAFRRQAVSYGAPIVVSEMVAGEALAAARPDVVRKTCRHEGRGLWVVQLAGRRPEDMLRGAEILVDAGVDVIDINMGCPSRQVTGGNSGSALMREPDLALNIIRATLKGAGGVPVTLKTRLGWDHSLLNAPELCSAAVDLGIQLVTLHGRTRCQFYKGQADWAAIRDTVDAVDVPVIANGDIGSIDDARSALNASGAFGVMIGRSAMGQPWLVNEIDAALHGSKFQKPSLTHQLDGLCEQIEESQTLYGAALGLLIFRKLVAAHIDKVELPIDVQQRREL